MRAAALLALVTFGCGAAYRYGPLEVVVAQPRPDDCAFDVVERVPERAYDPLGILAPEHIVSSKVASDEAAFKKAIADAVCAAGGDGVVAERDPQGRYVRATVVRWR